MKKSDGSLGILGGQNMFKAFVPTAAAARGDILTPHDETINGLFYDQVEQYKLGNKTKQQALADFRQAVLSQLGIGS
jgi:hypothetical protein